MDEPGTVTHFFSNSPNHADRGNSRTILTWLLMSEAFLLITSSL